MPSIVLSFRRNQRGSMTNEGHTAAISCRGVWKVFGPGESDARRAAGNGNRIDEGVLGDNDIVAVRDVSFDVRRGETFVVMGLSGSGKSTLVRCVSRLIEPSLGVVLIDGDDVTTMDRRELIELRRHKLAMVFQHFGLLPHRNVIDNVAFGLEIQGADRQSRTERAHEVIELVGLSGWGERFPHELSGGMQQRVGLARALAVDPETLLFDEPFSALDPLIRREMQDELLRLQDLLHKTMIFITHDFPEAVKMGDRVAIMRNGGFVQIGTAEELVCQPADDYVREFTEDVPRSHVLTAASVMQPSSESSLLAQADAVAHDTPLRTLIHLTARDDRPVAVTDREGRLAGYVDRAAILNVLDTGR